MVEVKYVKITPELRRKLKLPKWVRDEIMTINGVYSYNFESFDWKQEDSRAWGRAVAKAERAGFDVIRYTSDDDIFLFAVKGPWEKLNKAQANALFGEDWEYVK